MFVLQDFLTRSGQREEPKERDTAREVLGLRGRERMRKRETICMVPTNGGKLTTILDFHC